MGPPGAGKTTLVASYLKERKLPTLWYQLDEGDEDVASFFHYIGLSCKVAFPRLRRPLPHLSLEYRGSLATFTRRFFEDVYSRCKVDSVLVFDNCQEVPTDSQLYDVLEVALGEMPKGITCICLSRELPPPAFAQLQARQALHIFDPDRLRVTSEEVTALVRLRSQRRRAPSAAFTAKIHEKSSGWFAGLVLLLEHATGEPTMENTSCHETPQVLFDYLAQEEMRKLSEDTQQFLTKTAFLPVMTEQIAAQLTGMRAAGRMLNRLYQTRHFTERRFETEPVYQYHPLFRDFLLSRAAQVFPAAEVKSLQLRAARLLEESNRVEAAIDLLSAAGEPSELVRLILTHAPALFAQGRIQTLEAWLAKIPPP